MCFAYKTSFLMGMLVISNSMFSMEQLQEYNATSQVIQNGTDNAMCPLPVDMDFHTREKNHILLHNEPKDVMKFRKKIELDDDCMHLDDDWSFKLRLKGSCITKILKEHAGIDIKSECEKIMRNHFSRKDCKEKRFSPEFKEKTGALGEKINHWFEETVDEAEDILNSCEPVRVFLQKAFFKGREINAFGRFSSVRDDLNYRHIWKFIGKDVRYHIAEKFYRKYSFRDRDAFFENPAIMYNLDWLSIECWKTSLRSQVEEMIEKNPEAIIENKKLISILAGGTDKNGNTLFHLWPKYRLEGMEKLIEYYPKDKLAQDINVKNRWGETPLLELVKDFPGAFESYKYSVEEIVATAKVMINAGADITKCGNKLIEFAIPHRKSLVERWLQLGAIPTNHSFLRGTLRGLKGTWPGSYIVARALLRYGVTPNDDISFFELFKETNNAYNLALLLSYDLDLFKKRTDQSPRMWGVGDVSPMEYLYSYLETQVKEYDPKGYDHYDVRYRAALILDVAKGRKLVLDENLMTSNRISLYKLEKQLQEGGDPNTFGWKGFAFLHRAVIEQNIECIKLLMKHNADPDLKNAFGLSAREMNEQMIQAYSSESYFGKKALIIADLLDGKEPQIKEPKKPKCIHNDMKFVLKEIKKLICENQRCEDESLSFFGVLGKWYESVKREVLCI